MIIKHKMPSRNTHLLVGFLCGLDMFSQLSLLRRETKSLLAADSLRRENHHDRFVLPLLPVGRTARVLLHDLALLRAKLLSSLSSLLDRGHTLLVGSLRLLSWTK